MRDPEFQRLTAEVERTSAAYTQALDALARHLAARKATIAKAAQADLATLDCVRQEVSCLIELWPEGEWTSHSLALYLELRLRGLAAKTLENVYLPALRETCPHAVQSGQTWLWYKDAAQSRQVPRDTKADRTTARHPDEVGEY